MKKYKIILIHILFWVLFTADNIITYPKEYLEKYGYFDIGVKQSTAYLVYVIYFYINYFYVIPKFLSKKKYKEFTIALILLIIFTYVLIFVQAEFLDLYFSTTTHFFIRDRLEGLVYYIFQLFFYFLIAAGARFTTDWFKGQKLREELLKIKQESELKILKYQINPHFLFNTLNNIFSLANRENSAVAVAILKLSDLMRYLVRDIQQDRVELGKEMLYIKNYVDIQKLRIPDPRNIELKSEIDANYYVIAPMLLVPFIENAFKHGDLSANNHVVINLEVRNGKLKFDVINKINHSRKDSESGIGLTNVKRRLDLMYPERHRLEILADSNLYKINLELEL